MAFSIDSYTRLNLNSFNNFSAEISGRATMYDLSISHSFLHPWHENADINIDSMPRFISCYITMECK
jgi:hypothetical protein